MTSRQTPKWAVERKHRHELRRETILQAAAQCFNRKGYHGTTIEDIARELRVSKAALYYYVKGKEDLLFACHQASLDIAEEGLRRAQAGRGTLGEQLRTALEYFVEHTCENLRGCVLLLDEGMLGPRLHRQLVARRDRFEREVRDLVQAGVAAGTFVPCHPKMVVFAILGAINWIQRWYSPAGDVTPKEIAAIFADYLVRGLERARPEALAHAADAPPPFSLTRSDGGTHV